MDLFALSDKMPACFLRSVASSLNILFVDGLEFGFVEITSSNLFAFKYKLPPNHFELLLSFSHFHLPCNVNQHPEGR